MKLNYKRTIAVGFAFFLICTFWQAYDTIVPKILTDKFGMTQANSGIIMALDNILAIFLLPLFGTLSDKANTKLGRRTPFILAGTLAAAIALVGLSYVDGTQTTNLRNVEYVESSLYDTDYEGLTRQDSMLVSDALSLVCESQYGRELTTPDGIRYVITDEPIASGIPVKEYLLSNDRDGYKNDIIQVDVETFSNIRNYYSEDGKEPSVLYSDFYVSARQAYAAGIRESNPGTLALFIGMLSVALLSMAVFRSPAVALMPDVTIKPLRSKANSIINLMGTAGGILVLGLGMVFSTGSVRNSMMTYSLFFAVVAGIMVVALVVFVLTVKEPLFAKEAHEQSRLLNIDSDTDADSSKRRLSKKERLSLLLILASVVLWYMGYNAVISKYSVYAGKVLNLDYNSTLMIANVSAIITYIPAGLIASKIGRKKTVLGGVVMLTVAFAFAATLREGSNPLLMNCMFALAGIGWATINVNSFPMVVEMCIGGGNVGKFTGYYYTASMAAQVITPYLSGLIMDNTGMTSLFPYAAIFTALSFITMLFVKHGDSKPVNLRKDA